MLNIIINKFRETIDEIYGTFRDARDGFSRVRKFILHY